MTLQPTIEEFTALQQDLQAALSQRETLASQLRFVSTERDLLKDRLDKLMRKIFAAAYSGERDHRFRQRDRQCRRT